MDVGTWGAITGSIGTLTGVSSLGWTAWRYRSEAKQSLAISHGWQFAYGEDGSLKDVWINITAFNDGGRPLHIEYIGFEVPVVADRKVADRLGLDLPEGNNLWVTRRFEIALNGDTFEVAPDGPSVKIWTRLIPICRYGVDPTVTPILPFVVTWPERYWWEPEPSPLLPRPSQVHQTIEELGAEVAKLASAEIGSEEIAAAMTTPTDAPARTVGLERLVMDGHTQRISDLFGGDGEGDDGGGPRDETQ